MATIRKTVTVAVPVTVNQVFTYEVPDGMEPSDLIGRRVLVNFHGRKIRGFALDEGSWTDAYKIKQVDKVLDTRVMFRPEMVNFAHWLADYYFAGIGECLSLMVPKGKRPAAPLQEKRAEPLVHTLTGLQQKVYNEISNKITDGEKRFYLYGITGSGKTEIYVKLIEDTLAAGRSVLFLVPEIALSTQTLDRLKLRFGNSVALLHSGLKGSDRLREYLRLFDGEARIAVGPRSALFAPVENPGLIILDEENEGAYKSEESPRYHARSAALHLAKEHGATVLFGSATPSIEAWYHVKQGYFSLHSLTERFGGATLPDVRTIDTGSEPMQHNLSIPLIEAINRRLQGGDQVVLLQNRRGFSSLLLCASCETVVDCPRCDISLTWHKQKQKLVCHHCGYQSGKPDHCSECGSTDLKMRGAGTQRIEEDIEKVFPSAKVERIDYDSVKSSHDLKKLFDDIREKRVDILVGTQMIAKGLHFPGIKLVGIIDADLTLQIPDFKSAERTFALITQVSGRAGREGSRGEVIIQTAFGDHYAVKSAAAGDYNNFYRQEIEFRQILEMPPFTRLVRLVLRGADEESVTSQVADLAERIKLNFPKGCQMLGPAPCLLTKINRNYRYQVLLKSKSITELQQHLHAVLPSFKPKRNSWLEIDIDPSSLF
jgi:primosomal protein N' (replication factor Y)